MGHRPGDQNSCQECATEHAVSPLCCLASNQTGWGRRRLVDAAALNMVFHETKDAAMPPPFGPVVDTTPRPLPARVPTRGNYAVLEPLPPRHARELWQAAQGADDSFAYLGYGPFASEEAITRVV